LAESSTGNKLGTIVLFVVAFMLGVVFVVWLTINTTGEGEATPVLPTVDQVVVGPTRTLRPTRTPSPTETPAPPPSPSPSPSPSPLPSPDLTESPAKIGIVAGHWQNDVGAVCPDGLKEVRINLDVASQVVSILQDKGYRTELLPEFSERLDGYEAALFLSIHADSCADLDISGFKVARVAASAIPEEEDRLVACLTREYRRGTGLEFHKNSITYDMTDYHAFREIDGQTPGAIIELGFMGADRDLLTEHSAQVARAVVNGILCFLEGE
jgi:N-acetylmuramoyl-L-alanine amidase